MIQATFPLRWTASDRDPLLEALAIVDCDISQAVQSCKEQIVGGNLDSEALAGAALEELYQALGESKRQTAAWGGEFAFDRVRGSDHACGRNDHHISQGYFAVEDWRRKALRRR